HNEERSTLGVPPLQWNSTLASSARDWSSKCTNRHSNGTLGPLGENLAARTGAFSVSDAVRAIGILREERSYDPMNPQPSHWTQVLWKDTTDLGVIFSVTFASLIENQCRMQRIAQYHVCEYWPAGNVLGTFRS
ncbi:PR-1-like protein, partial [Favolaschia claudopus]